MERRLTDEGWQPFVSHFVHEAKAPLTAIIGYISLALEAIKTNQVTDATEHLQSARESAQRQLAILNMLSLLARLEEGRLTLRRFDLAELCRDIVQEYTQAHPDRTIILNAPHDVGLVNVDVHLPDIIRALLDNALRYSAPDTPVTIATMTIGNEVTISVQDEGIGIPAEELADVFDPYYRLRATPQPQSAGNRHHTGLSLYAAKLYAERNGGRLWVESQLNRGSTFTLALPADETR
jgi:signal transduction histidine kinase